MGPHFNILLKKKKLCRLFLIFCNCPLFNSNCSDWLSTNELIRWLQIAIRQVIGNMDTAPVKPDQQNVIDI